MKKILTLLGSVSLIATSATTVISCQDNRFADTQEVIDNSNRNLYQLHRSPDIWINLDLIISIQVDRFNTGDENAYSLLLSRRSSIDLTKWYYMYYDIDKVDYDNITKLKGVILDDNK